MKPTDIAHMRLHNQQIAATDLQTAADIVSWMGAMQAQDYPMCKWAVGIRLPGSTEADIEKAIDDGHIIRTHVLRPTWHLISAKDIHWMTALSVQKIKSFLKLRHKELNITPAILKKSNSIIEKALSKQHLTRKEIVAELKKGKLAVDDNRSSHLLLWAELEGIACSGIHKEKEPTYALLSERVPEKKIVSREEAIAMLAHKYFSSHGPATIPDFVWWAGVTVAEAKKAMETIKDDFVMEKTKDQVFYFSRKMRAPLKKTNAVHLLPAFDEYIISYKDRSAVIDTAHHPKAFSNNGIFRPVIVVGAQGTGIWKRTFKKDTVIVETDFFKQPVKTTMPLVKKAVKAYGQFLQQKAEWS